VNDRMKALRFSRIELKVQGIARRKANHQLLRVPWDRFRRAYDEYPRWQGLALWGELLNGTGARGQSSVLATINKHCPGFVEGRSRLQRSTPLGLHLLEWVHTKKFDYAKRQGWLDALIFYGVRHPFSRGAWAYWEDYETKSNPKGTVSISSFERWWRTALQRPLCEAANCATVAAAVESYIEWEAFTLWLCPLFFSGIGLPQHALAELRRRCPGICDFSDLNALRGTQTGSTKWRQIAKARDHHVLSRARQEGWHSKLLEQVRSHPWHVRLHAYAARWKHDWTRSPVAPYPSLRQWKQAAAHYINSGPVPRSVGPYCPNASSHISGYD
jgi:hypothetical protein